MSMSRTDRGRYGRIAAGVLLLALSGCATAPPRPPLVEMTWPEPPLTPRIKFVRTIASDRDLGQQTETFTERLLEVVAGKKPSVGHLAEPMDVAISDDGQRVYVSDYNQGVIYRFDLEQKQVTLLARERPLAHPFGLALDASETLYVVEQGARRVVVLDREGNVTRVIGDASLERPTSVVLDRRRGRLYVADPARQASPEHSVKVFDLDGKLVAKVGNGKGACDGCLYFPTYLALDRQGNLYVTNTMDGRVDVFAPDGKYVKRIGDRGTSYGMFDRPKGVALDSFGNVYVVDSGWSNVQIFNAKGQVLLYFGGRGAYPGLLKNPSGIAIDRNNRIYVADYLNYRVSVYELVNTRAGDSVVGLPPAGTREGAKTAKSEATPAAGGGERK